uniref:RING-type domain-containing protein n=1 Tax=Macrostomum lignano TaxID=282301 RepID=A0A1I8I302_9PLAT
MPCGHAIGPDSLTMYCRSLLDSGLYRFLCPWLDPNDSRVGCPVEWDFVVIRRLAVLSDEERQEFERKISENYLRRAVNIQISRDAANVNSVFSVATGSFKRVPELSLLLQARQLARSSRVCPACSSGGRQRFEFCWYCLNKWRSAGTDKCGNDICSGKDPRIAILAAAPVKEIVGVKDVPGRRACIHCGMIIEHVRSCKHMKCICGQEFCFICLKPKNSEGNWQCGSFNAPFPCPDLAGGLSASSFFDSTSPSAAASAGVSVDNDAGLTSSTMAGDFKCWNLAKSAANRTADSVRLFVQAGRPYRLRAIRITCTSTGTRCSWSSDIRQTQSATLRPTPAASDLVWLRRAAQAVQPIGAAQVEQPPGALDYKFGAIAEAQLAEARFRLCWRQRKLCPQARVTPRFSSEAGQESECQALLELAKTFGAASAAAFFSFLNWNRIDMTSIATAMN